ncbi:XRE family transcriptional regulator [Staphylococcus saprophyticus]|uniref:XRE family transcriptional regulator n=1 Tax=Staphylococcus saprophyticus TaxID=29385 RepID=UPI000853DCE5|nr:XRE family transcriptional regulator [Staphylococcus saprophyticus]MDW3782174.1 XRE family transcriptional regulator [Staphylococcus saprophyticus]MDW3933567.1 XRE family transcriptional regulator [Staphylococcus saprophyticus]MDW3953077.1 XRE family transcriptional regulator [Staphylococcus saprophyticus]MDW3954914.1 XRE family transcriptional regulator [Staphylococcus saprophyticus]MDW4354787.1 XRE family transcriptional regulator [Staphylococcus saprophyticus]
MAFKNTIKEVRLNNRLTKVEMAKKLDVSEGTIRMWENGKNEPRMGMIEKIANLFNVSKSYLLGDIEEYTVPEFDSEIEIPYFGKVSAGNFEEVAIDKETLKTPSSVYNGRNPNECIALQVNGDSMNKVLTNGSYIIVHDYRMNQDYKLNSNDILVLRLGGEYTVKRVRRTETKLHLDPASYSDEFKTNSFDLESVGEIEVIGKVIYNFQSFD